MNNYNEEILEFIPKYGERIIEELKKKHDITNLDYSVSGTEDTSVSNYLSLGSDSYFLFDFTYDYDGKSHKFTIKIPKMVGGVFVINGKVAIPFNTLVTDFRLKLLKGVLKIDDTREVKKYRGHYMLVIKDRMKEVYSYDLSDPETYGQIPTQYLELTDDQVKIAKSKVFIESKLITPALCDALFKYGETEGKFSNICDVTVKSTADYIKSNMNKDFYAYMNTIRYRFNGGNRAPIGEVSTTELNSGIIRYFSTNSGNFNYFTNVTNPLTLQSLSSQVKVPYGNSMNPSVFDLIDVADTPINTNINKINYLNRNVSVDNGRVYIEVYNKDKKRVKLDKLDYASQNILNSDCWDYKNWKLKPKYEGKEIPVKFGKYEIFVDSLDDIDYIELEPNERTSVTSGVIPMINKSEFARMSMGTSMVKQGVNLINAEDPLVTTQDLKTLIHLNPLMILAENDGTVESVTRTKVVVKSDTGGNNTYIIPYALQSYTGNLVPFIPVVEVGSRVSKGDIIISPSNISEHSIKYGINAIAAFSPFFGYNSDDSIIISESFADRIASVYTYDQVISIKNVNQIKFIKKAGTYVSSGDVLTSVTVNKNKRYSKLLDEGEFENIINKTAMNNLVNAFLYETKVILGPKLNLDPESFEIIDNLDKDIDLSPIKGQVPLLPDNDPSVAQNEIKVIFRFIMRRKAVVGDKLTNRYGNKGVISKIVPDKDMIRAEDGTVAEIVFSRESVPARKNISQIYELYLGQLSREIKKLYYKSDQDKVRAVGAYNTVYQTHYSVDEFDEYVKEYGDFAFNAKVGTYSEFELDDLIKSIDDLGIQISKPAYIGSRKLKQNVLFGPMYIVKLPYLPENTMAVTTTRKMIGSQGPELGLGKYRGEGQKLGEMESTALAVNSPELLEYYKSKGGVSGNLNRLYFDFLDLGIDIGGITEKVIKSRVNDLSLTKDEVDKLNEHFK